MQILNVGAGRSDEEYKAAESDRREDLQSTARGDADCFFYAAGLAALGTGLLFVRLQIFVSIGVIDLLRFYGRSLGAAYLPVLYGSSVAWVLTLVGLGFAARRGWRWAFLAGVALYACDMFALITMFSIWAFGVHAFFVYKWWEGQRALRDLQEPGVVTA